MNTKRLASGEGAKKVASKPTSRLGVRKSTTNKSKPATLAQRVVMDHVAKPKHFSVAAIRSAVRRVAAR